MDSSLGGFGLGLGGLFGLGLVGDIAALLDLLGNIGVDTVLAVVADKVGQVLNGAGASVFNGLLLATGRVELDGGESLDGVGHVVGSGIDLGDGHLLGEFGVVLVESGELVILGCQSAFIS